MNEIAQEVNNLNRLNDALQNKIESFPIWFDDCHVEEFELALTALKNFHNVLKGEKARFEDGVAVYLKKKEE
jgi:predicted AAA+ superfamily ATPase